MNTDKMWYSPIFSNTFRAVQPGKAVSLRTPRRAVGYGSGQTGTFSERDFFFTGPQEKNFAFHGFCRQM